MATSKSTSKPTAGGFPVPAELRARYDRATVTDEQIGAYWRAQATAGGPAREEGYRIGDIDRRHPEADRRLVGPRDFPEYEHLIRLTRARKEQAAAERAARTRTEKHRPCEFCGLRNPSGPPISLPGAVKRRGCVNCAPLYAQIVAEELAAASGDVGGVDVAAVMRQTACAEAVAHVAAREAAWARLEADPNPITAA